LKDWDGSKEAQNINVDTLLLNGRNDEVTELCVEPWFRAIPKIKWVVFEKSSHMPHWEERKRYMELVGTFLTSY
jgi:pimeloyl-ACP methyl ester carboxylesterase